LHFRSYWNGLLARQRNPAFCWGILTGEIRAILICGFI
jgi:hypothetical protein